MSNFKSLLAASLEHFALALAHLSLASLTRPGNPCDTSDMDATPPTQSPIETRQMTPPAESRREEILDEMEHPVQKTGEAARRCVLS